MAKKFVWATLMLMLYACIQHVFIQHASAMGELTIVTKETQVELGLNYTLVAERVDAEAVLVSMEIPRQGKLKNLRSVSLHIGPGRPLVAATLQTTPGKQGSWVVAFQLSPDLADKSSIFLVTPYGPTPSRTYGIYAVELKGYVTDRK